MIKVVAKHVVREECIEAFLEAGKEVVAASVNDAGNIYYTMNKSLDDPKVFTILEAWESMPLLQAHMETEHFKRLVPVMGEMLEGEGSIEVYEELF